MSFNGFKDKISEGDTVILFLTVNQVYAVNAEPKTKNKKGNEVDNVFQTLFGALRCADLIGKDYGSKIELSKGWGYVLQPTPELWTLTLPHRTQIIYTPDISMIMLQLEINPSSIVIESGTGSGSLSHALIRAVKPHGHLYTYDFHEDRVQTAKEEFKTHGLNEYVTVEQRDVCENGFTDTVKANAIFLDLPHPWLAIKHAVKSFQDTGGRICSFSPCIEQVQKSCVTLAELGFQEIETMEVLQTQYNVQNRNLTSLNLDFLKTPKSEDSKDNKVEKQSVSMSTIVPPASQPGHTGFLTFATFPPIWARSTNVDINY